MVIHSRQRITEEFRFKGLDCWRKNFPGQTLHPWLVYGGVTHQSRERGKVVSWNDLSPLLDALLPD
jgi:hypothetical protein